MGVATAMVGPTGTASAAGLEQTRGATSRGAVAHVVRADPHVDRPGPHERGHGRPEPEQRHDRSERGHDPHRGPDRHDEPDHGRADDLREVDAESPVPAGDASGIESSGWRPKATVSFTLVGPDGGPVGGAVVVTANMQGDVTGDVTIPVPADAVAGTYTVVGTDADGGSAAAPLDVYAPSLSATSPVPAAGRTGITSGGWRAATDVTLQLADVDGNPAGDPVTVTTDEDGDVPAGTVLAVPAVPAGTTLTLLARDDAGARASADVAVTAANEPVVDASSPVPAGGGTTVTSSGWTGETTVVLRLTDAAGALVGDPVTMTTDAGGNVPAGATVPVPADATAGVYTLTVTDGAGRAASDELRAYAPWLGVEPAAAPGGCAAVTSRGWLPGAEVTLRAVPTDGASPAATTTATADEDGTLPADVCAPVPDGVSPGDVTVVGIDGTGGRAEAAPPLAAGGGVHAQAVGTGGPRAAGIPVALLTLVLDAAMLVAAHLTAFFADE